MFIGNAASVGCKEATIEPLAALTTPESKYYADHFIETVVEERNGQLTRFAEAYKTLKPGLQFYETQAKRAADQHYQLKKQYETGLEEHRKKLSVTFKELSARYEATAKQEIAKAVKSVKANEQSAEEICKNFARNLLKDFGSALPTESKNSATPSTPSAKR